MTCLRCEEARRRVYATAGALRRGRVKQAMREASEAGKQITAKVQDEATRIRERLRR